jgi:hypothetical protein
MEQIGWSLVDAGGHETQFWGDTAGQCPGIPNPLILSNGDHVHCAAIGEDHGGYKLFPRYLDYTGTDGKSFDGTKVVVTRSPPDPVQIPPRCIAAAFGLQVSDGDISNIDGAFNIIAALYLDVGQYMLLFCVPEPDANYFAQASGDALFSVTEKSTDYVTVSTGGADVQSFNVQVYRI